VIPFLARIPIRVGIAHKRKLFMTHAVERPLDSEKMYFGRYMAKVMRLAMGLHLDSETVTHLHVASATVRDRMDVEEQMPAAGGGMRIAVAPFTSTPMKNWPLAYYQEFFDALREHYHPQFFILGSVADAKKTVRDRSGCF